MTRSICLLRLVRLVAALLLTGAASAGATELRWSIPAEGTISDRGPLEIRFDPPREGEAGRVAVFLDRADVTELFEVGGAAATLRSDGLPLPIGRHTLIVYAVSPAGEWVELGRREVRVRSAAGWEKREWKPALDLANEGRLDHDGDPDGPEEAYQDLTGQIGFQSAHARNGMEWSSEVSLTAVTNRAEALRFSSMAHEAPKVDLARYRFTLARGGVQLSVGHVGFGSQRYLLDGLNSRGLVLSLPVGRRGKLQLGALSGSSIAGWDNPFGIAESDHRILGASLGFELLPRAGALYVEASFLDGSVLPVGGYNQGAILSAERSSGYGMSLSTASANGRLTLRAGTVNSRFEPAPDPELEEGIPLVALEETRRNASWIDASLALLQGRPLGERFDANVTLGVGVERIDPLFRSVGAFVQPDTLRLGATLAGNLGPLGWSASWSELEDNLDDIESVLKTTTEQAAASGELALGQFASDGSRAALWLPTLSAAFERIHQAGAGIPDNSGFAPSHVPDQRTESASASLGWYVGAWNFGVRWNETTQDNRQEGREAADLESGSASAYLGYSFGERLNLTVDLGEEWLVNEQIVREETTERLAATLSWRALGRLWISAHLSRQIGGDDLGQTESRAREGWVELSHEFRLRRAAAEKPKARLFLRYSDRDGRQIDRTFEIDDRTSSRSLTSGVTLSIF